MSGAPAADVTPQKAREMRLDAAGLCVTCGRAPQFENRKRCERCTDAAREAARRHDARLKAEGLCRCGRRPPSGHKRCATCARKALAKYRADHPNAGRCPCGKRYTPGLRRCATCRAASRARTKARHRAILDAIRSNFVARGLCRECGEPKEDGYTRCQKHLDAAKAREQRKHARREAAGLCVLCGKNPPKEGKRSCVACLRRIAAAKEIARGRRAKR